MFKRILALVGLSLSSLTLSAATLDFGTWSGSNCGVSGCAFDGGTNSVTVSSSQGTVTQGLFGLGVDSGTLDDWALDNNWPGANPEALTFSFTHAVILDSIDLGLFDNIFDSGKSFYTLDGGSAVTITDSITLVGLEFSDLVISTNTRGFLESGTSFRVNQLQVSSVVPVPAAVWLFGSALLGLVGIKRKK